MNKTDKKPEVREVLIPYATSQQTDFIKYLFAKKRIKELENNNDKEVIKELKEALAKKTEEINNLHKEKRRHARELSQFHVTENKLLQEKIRRQRETLKDLHIKISNYKKQIEYYKGKTG